MTRRRITGFLAACGMILVGYLILSPGPPQKSRPRELEVLRTVLPDRLTEYANLEVDSASNVAILENGRSSYLGLGIKPDQRKKNKGVRAELSVNYPYQPGDTVVYSWRLRIPADFVSDAPRNRWWLIGQWHDQPNPHRGESWSDFPSSSPPIHLALGELGGRVMVSLGYGVTATGLKQQNHGPVPLDRGSWHHIVVRIHWSRQSDGTADVFIDDPNKPVFTASGPNMNNDYQHYWKVGMYRHPEIATENWIHLDDLEANIIHDK